MKARLTFLLVLWGVIAQAQFIINPYTFGNLDPDASAFIAATGINNQTQIDAVNKLVKDLKTYGIWAKCIAIYPMIGGTAATHKFNLKDPRDLDAAYRLTFTGTWTHSAQGATPSSAYADTYITPSVAQGADNKHLSFWSRTSATPSVCLMGCTNASSYGDMLMPNFSGNDNYSSLSSLQNSKATGTTYNGFHLITRSVSTSANYFRDGANKFTETVTGGFNVSVKLYIGARNGNGSATQYTSHQCAFASVGSGLTDTEVANFYTAVAAYQTSLSR